MSNNEEATLRMELNTLNNRILELTKQLHKLQDYLFDDDSTKNAGIVRQTRENTAAIQSLQQKEAIRNARIGLIAGGVTAALAVLKWVAELVFSYIQTKH